MSRLDRWRTSLRRRAAELRSKLMVRLANRTFNKNPNRLDRVAMAVLSKAAPPAPEHDPELDHDALRT